MPDQLGRYLLHEPLGQGGMSEVFRATLEGPMGFSKEVAVKRVSPRLTEDRENVRALINEARIGALLRHRNVVEVFELDQADGAWFVAMELVHGKTLWEILDRCRSTGAFLPRAVALAIVEQASEGLAYAHAFGEDQGKSIGLVHRDLKPANLMLSDRGVVKIMDFGIARSSMRFYETSLGGPLKGTPLYMAPEQFEGTQASPASDVFSLSVMLYEMLTNARIFLAPTTAGVIERLTRMDLEPFLQPIQGRDPELGQLLRRGLDRNPRTRFRTAAEFCAAAAALRSVTPVNLDEFVRYLQLAPRRGLITPAPADPWTWDPPGDLAEPGSAPAGTRPLEEVALDLQHFGVAFFGPVLFPDSRARELDAARRSVIPHYGSFRSGVRAAHPRPAAVGQNPVDTTAPTRVSPGVTDRTPTEVGHEPVDPGTLSRPRRSGGGLILLGVGVLVTVGLAILAGMFIGRPRMGPADLECYIAAVEGGDWDTAAAVAARAGLVPEGPQARLVLAMDAALAGQDAEAASRLGDAQTLPDPLRSRARLLEGGLARRGPSGYTDAARAYGQALDCAGPGCTPILESARAGLMLACIAGEESARAPCSRSRAPAWSSSAERSLVRSVVLLRDGHEEGALDALRVGLETSGSLACTGSAALRVWADERERVERAGMAPLLDARGRASSRNRDDCQLFEEAGR